MLALATGWTPDVLAALPTRFRRACHWLLYARTIAGPDGFPATEAAPGTRMTPDLQAKRVAVMHLRTLLYPEDDDG